MAAWTSSLSSVISSHYLILILFCFVRINGHAHAESNFHSVHVSSLAPPTACNPASTTARSGASSLSLVNRHGPCNQKNQEDHPSLGQILTADGSRHRGIQARYAKHKNPTAVFNSDATLPANTGEAFDAGNYIVTVGLGTPKNDFTLIFDTGSDLTWAQCEPCSGSCFKQKGPIFDPEKSTTYSNISCSSPKCLEVASATGNNPGCSAPSASSTCTYGIRYGDGSFSVGLFGQETLTLTPNDVFDGFLFGCGQNNSDLFGEVAGLIGLGRDPLSMVSQTSSKYGKVFSYCLPTASGSNGHLTFGNGTVPGNVRFTPFSTSQPDIFYFIDLEAIAVGGKMLNISATVFQSSGTLIDSGTVVTRLPSSAYTALRDAFKEEMAQFKMAPPFSLLDTCFDLRNQTNVRVPKISFVFSGNVTVDLDVEGILIAVDGASQVCLVFAGNSDDSDVGIFGNLQQQTLEIVYDVAGGKLGFGQGGCS